MNAPGPHDPWPLSGRLDQRDPALAAVPDIAPYGCAMMLCFASGAYLADRDPPDAAEVLAMHAAGVRDGLIGDECFIESWERVIDMAAGQHVVEYTDRHEPADFPLDPGWLVFDCWKRTDRNVGVHFTIRHPILYDPLGSAEPGLSWSRKLGQVVSRRAFRIVGGPRA